jgi:hypothetical protein
MSGGLDIARPLDDATPLWRTGRCSGPANGHEGGHNSAQRWKTPADEYIPAGQRAGAQVTDGWRHSLRI